MFALCTGAPLFPVNRDDDLSGGEAMNRLHCWSDAEKLRKLEAVADPIAQDLLSRLLSQDPARRCAPGKIQCEYASISEGELLDRTVSPHPPPCRPIARRQWRRC